jgi:hypothetical protein
MRRAIQAIGAGVIAAGVALGSAGVASAGNQQEFLDRYHATGAPQLIPDDQLVYWATKYCRDKADGLGGWWHSHPFNFTYSPTTAAEVADQTLCPSP